MSSEVKHHKKTQKNSYAYYQKIVISYNYVTIRVQASVFIKLSNRIEKLIRQHESNFSTESECSNDVACIAAIKSDNTR